jgi:hypothetical protein
LCSSLGHSKCHGISAIAQLPATTEIFYFPCIHQARIATAATRSCCYSDSYNYCISTLESRVCPLGRSQTYRSQYMQSLRQQHDQPAVRETRDTRVSAFSRPYRLAWRYSGGLNRSIQRLLAITDTLRATRYLGVAACSSRARNLLAAMARALAQGGKRMRWLQESVGDDEQAQSHAEMRRWARRRTMLRTLGTTRRRRGES